MSDIPHDHTYRVVVVRAGGSRIFVQGNLSKAVADAVQATLLSTFPEVLVERELLPDNPPAATPDAPPESG